MQRTPDHAPSALRRHLERREYEAFLDLLSAELPGQAGGLTRKNYVSSLRVFLRWCSEETRSVLNATQADALAYQSHLQGRGTPATVHNHMTRVRTLYSLLLARGEHPGPNPYDGLKLPSNRPEEHRDLYTGPEITRLLAHGDVTERLLVLLGAHVGLTGPETVALRWEAVNTHAGHLDVRGRHLEADAQVYAALREYGRERGHTDLFAATGPLFDFQTDHQLRAALFRLCMRANVPYRAWRALRNTAGLRILEQTGDPAVVARRLGLGTLKAVEVWKRLSGPT